MVALLVAVGLSACASSRHAFAVDAAVYSTASCAEGGWAAGGLVRVEEQGAIESGGQHSVTPLASGTITDAVAGTGCTLRIDVQDVPRISGLYLIDIAGCQEMSFTYGDARLTYGLSCIAN